jgi:putative FmdB family regulatory protein
MPTYVYACTNPDCRHQFEAVQAFTDDALTVCPVCGLRLRKVFGSVGVVFKGSGFYRNDSREKVASSSAKGDPKAEKSTAGAESAGSGSGSSESGGSSTGKSESGSAAASSAKPTGPSTPSAPAKASGTGSTASNGSSKAKQGS